MAVTCQMDGLARLWEVYVMFVMLGEGIFGSIWSPGGVVVFVI